MKKSYNSLLRAENNVPSITARVYGGLGNQLFIYAAARALADRVGGHLTLDSSLFTVDTVYHRKLLLGEFPIRATHQITHHKPWFFWLRRFHVRLQVRVPYRSQRWLIERTPLRFQPDVCAWHGRRVTLDGYWQSEGYFADDANVIRRDLTPLQASDFDLSAIAERIRKTENSVFLHVRSYREVPGQKERSFSLSGPYFRNAVSFICGNVCNPEFFLFSDDPQWARGHLSLPADVSCSVVSDNPGVVSSPLSDFHLMTLCRHAVVANSSFSWWAAWLGEQRRKAENVSGAIVCPQTPNKNDYYPSRWSQIVT